LMKLNNSAPAGKGEGASIERFCAKIFFESRDHAAHGRLLGS
jgi:hypothetical protein